MKRVYYKKVQLGMTALLTRLKTDIAITVALHCFKKLTRLGHTVSSGGGNQTGQVGFGFGLVGSG
jgi:hypothetical protein